MRGNFIFLIAVAFYKSDSRDLEMKIFCQKNLFDGKYFATTSKCEALKLNHVNKCTEQVLSVKFNIPIKINGIKLQKGSFIY